MSDDPHRTAYDPDLTLREARSIYFAANDFGSDGGYAKRWVRLQIGLVPVFFPNLPSRLRAVRFHDLHHVLTGYATDWRGEGEIGAWEIGAGCGRESFAWFADLLSLVPGLLVAPRATFRAYVRGRRSRNLYGRRFDDALLARRVGEVRREIGLDPGDPPPRRDELWRFAGWTALGLGILLSPLLLPLGLLTLLA